jgi:predicted extracellular nuclease
VQDRSKAAPEEIILLTGDFNAFQFNDGYNDLIGILKGRSDQNVITPSPTAFETGLANMADYVSDERDRYSYVYEGSAQVLDHILFNRPARKHILKVGYARINADFPLVYANDPNRPERVSDHDAPLVFLTIEPRQIPKAQ